MRAKADPTTTASPRGAQPSRASLTESALAGALGAAGRGRFPIASAMRRVMSKGYGLSDLRADVLAGLVVGIVALPLSMALAIAVGVPPQHGLYTAIFAGASVALLGGCKFQVTGPTAAFVVILAPIVSRHGLSGLLVAGLMAGLMLVGMGAARLGRLIEFIPHPVTTGFTTGIALVIAALQIKDAFGLETGAMPEHFSERLAVLWAARGTAKLADVVVAGLTLGLLIGVPKITKRIPSPLIAVGGVGVLAAAVHAVFPGFEVATIGSRFTSVVGGVEISGIPPVLPVPALPWGSGLTFALVRELFPAAFAIALLGAIESLLSGVIADGMTGTRHDPNAELVGLGVGNIIAPFFGGIAATGALARTATNIRAGARSPIASFVHAAFVLFAMLALARVVAFIPMASLAGLLVMVAWNMSELKSFIRVVRVAPKSDVFVLLTCFGLTVLFDMVVAVSTGVVLAAILFMRRMAEMTQSRAVLDSISESEGLHLPRGAALYEINGPLFFGAAQRAMSEMQTIRGDTFDVMILDLGKVSVIDSTGLVSLENAIVGLVSANKTVILAGPLPRPSRIWEKARLEAHHRNLRVVASLKDATTMAGDLLSHPTR